MEAEQDQKPHPRKRWLYAVLLILVAAAALGYQRQGLRLRDQYHRRTAALSRELRSAYDLTAALRSRAARPPEVAASGDTLYLTLADERSADGLEEMALYVDKTRGGLRARYSDGHEELVAPAVDGFSVGRETTPSGRHVYLVELSAVWRTASGPHVRRSLCRYLTEREMPSG